MATLFLTALRPTPRSVPDSESHSAKSNALCTFCPRNLVSSFWFLVFDFLARERVSLRLSRSPKSKRRNHLPVLRWTRGLMCHVFSFCLACRTSRLYCIVLPRSAPTALTQASRVPVQGLATALGTAASLCYAQPGSLRLLGSNLVVSATVPSYAALY
eukprot:2399200-Rhodomonas_salina.2